MVGKYQYLVRSSYWFYPVCFSSFLVDVPFFMFYEILNLQSNIHNLHYASG